jgi:hypothetical protein
MSGFISNILRQLKVKTDTFNQRPPVETGGMRKAPIRGQKPMPYMDISNSNIEIRMPETLQ